jgi:beta-RFAP synthase
MTVRVVAPCRLHFGLLHVPVPGLTQRPDGTAVRTFGGAGLMVEDPQVVVTARRADDWSASGSLADRALQFARGASATPVRLHADGPAEHVGLGVGTALGLAVSRAVTGIESVADLAVIAGRGERSGVGMYGFATGGFVIDAGKSEQDRLPVLGGVIPFPAEWRVVLVLPDQPSAWHGTTERAAFARPRDRAQAARCTDRLEHLLHNELAPAVTVADFGRFAPAVYEYNRLAGEPFAADQKGTYTGRIVAALIEAVRAMGFPGVGQSSWGPTVFAVTEDEDRAAYLADVIGGRFAGLKFVKVVKAATRGAVVSSD